MIKENNFKKYTIYALGEILLIMIGILLALQINNWNTQRTKKRSEIRAYHNIKRHIQDDKSEIMGASEYNYRYLKPYEFANQIIERNNRNKIDTLGYISIDLTKYSDFNRNSNIYQNLLNSGELKLLSNREITNRLQRLEETYIYMNRVEKSHSDLIRSIVGPALQKSIRFSDRSVQNANNLFGFEFQNIFISMISVSYEKNRIYIRALNEIGELTELINDELRLNDKFHWQTTESQTTHSTPKIDLHTAVIIGDFEAIREHINSGSDLNTPELSRGSTPLITASALGKTLAARILTDAGAKINYQNNDGSTALHTAAFFDHVEIVKILLEKGAGKTIKNKGGRTAIEALEIPFENIKSVYDAIGVELRLAGIELDYDHIKNTRPQIIEMLK